MSVAGTTNLEPKNLPRILWHGRLPYNRYILLGKENCKYRISDYSWQRKRKQSNVGVKSRQSMTFWRLTTRRKKSDRRYCGNYREVMLLSVLGKVLSRVILERLRTAVGDKVIIRYNQARFRRERPCTDQIDTLRITLEQFIDHEWNSFLYVNFVDYEKAFDSLDRERNLSPSFAAPMKAWHACLVSAGFKILTGVRQGCRVFYHHSCFFWLLTDYNKDYREREKRNPVDSGRPQLCSPFT